MAAPQDVLRVECTVPVPDAGGGAPYRVLAEGEAYDGRLLVKRVCTLLESADSDAIAVQRVLLDRALPQSVAFRCAEFLAEAAPEVAEVDREVLVRAFAMQLGRALVADREGE